MAKWNSGGDYELAPEGPQLSTCVSIIAMGTQDTNYGPKGQVNFGFETQETDSGGHPYMLRTTLTVSLSPKSKARPIIEALLGRPLDDQEEQGGFDDRDLLGRICVLDVEHSADGKYANIKGAMRSMKGQKPWKTTMPHTYLSFEQLT
jgi:hypothetical protein